MNSSTLATIKRLFPVIFVIMAVVAFNIYYKDDIKDSQVDYNSYEKEVKYAVFTSNDNIELKFELDIADTSFSRARGLMYREEYPANSAMHFVYPTQTGDKFWMRNTLINLDIIFLNSVNEIVYIASDAPPCETESCPLYGPDFEYSSVIEINGGLAKKYGIKVADKVTFVD